MYKKCFKQMYSPVTLVLSLISSSEQQFDFSLLECLISSPTTLSADDLASYFLGKTEINGKNRRKSAHTASISSTYSHLCPVTLSSLWLLKINCPYS